MPDTIRINVMAFIAELGKAGALAGFRGACENGDIFFLADATPEQIAAIEAVAAVHDPTAVDPKAAALAELAALEAAPILLSRALEDVVDALPPEAAAAIPEITRNRIARKKELRAALAQLA